MTGDRCAQIVPGKHFHDQITLVVLLPPVVDADDAGALQGRGGRGLLAEALGEGRVAGVLRQHQLDGHPAPEHRVLGGPDGGHAPDADPLFQEIAASQYPLAHAPTLPALSPPAAPGRRPRTGRGRVLSTRHRTISGGGGNFPAGSCVGRSRRGAGGYCMELSGEFPWYNRAVVLRHSGGFE